MGQCIDRLKDKSKEKTCIKGGKQTVRKTNRQEQESLKLRSLSFLFHSPSPSLVLESHSVSKLETHHT